MFSVSRVARVVITIGLFAGAAALSAPAAAQGQCKRQNEGCGAGIGGACCDNLWCHNGACKRYQQAGEPCGTPAQPPCQPNSTACVNGRCQAR